MSTLGLIALLAGCCVSLPAAEPDQEQQLIQILTSTASPKEKDAACAKLKNFGTAKCVPALAALLPDEQLSHSARYALESMHLPEAGAALVAALNKTSGLTQVGIICSLGARGEMRAATPLAKLLSAQDEAVAVAAAQALGQIGQPEAIRPLQSAATSTRQGRVHDAAIDSLLRCAHRLVLSGKTSKALAVYERIYADEKNDGLRLAAFRGMIRAYGPHGVKLVTRSILGPPGPAQTASLQMVREIQARGATEEFAGLLPRVNPSLQIALLENLAQRGDPAAVPVLAGFAGSAPREAHVALIRALGQLGDASLVPLLSGFAAGGSNEERAAARQALIDLNRGNVSDMLVGQLATTSPDVQAELARALGNRGDVSAIPKLFHLAEKDNGSARSASLKALGLLVDEPQLSALLRYTVTTPDAAARSDAADALNYACQHIVSKHGRIDAEPLVRSMVLGSKDARLALIPVCGRLINPQVRIALRTAVEDPDPEVRAMAVRTLCDTADPELLPDVVSLAHTTKDEKFRSLAIAAGVRLTTEEETVKISRGQRVAALKSMLASATTPEQKRLVISGLGEMPDSDALRAVDPFLEDSALATEASRAAIKIATALPGSYAQESIAVLNKGLGTVSDDGTRKALETAIKQLQDSMDFITDWMVAGPFHQDGKDYAALFDVVFPPETEDPKGVDWKVLTPGVDPKRPFVMDLFKMFGCQQCVAYARTWVQCEKEEPMLLELGSDDGVKVWLNDKQVYALNTARALTPGSDKVNITLHPGWNMLLLKVTQNNLGWEFCAKLLKPDGSHLDGFKVESAPKAISAEATPNALTNAPAQKPASAPVPAPKATAAPEATPKVTPAAAR